MSHTFIVAPGGALRGTLRVPGDKSISHRTIMLGAIAEGCTQVTGFLEGEDALSTMNAFRAMGVSIEGPDQGRVTIQGVGLHGLKAPNRALDCGNSGTSMRLISGLLAGQPFAATLTGDASLQRRPMGRIAEPLRAMGAHIHTQPKGLPPLEITPVEALHGIDYTMPVASAQVKSALLLAGLYARGTTRVTEPEITRDHTERMLNAMGYAVHRVGSTVSVQGRGTLHGTSIDVPADISSAAFFMVGASLAPGSDLLLTHVGVNPTRTGVLQILQLMGADLTLLNQREVGGEPVADIRVRHAPLRGIEVPESLVALAIDEFPILFVAAAGATGRTVVRGAAELRVKESDRIQGMADGLQTLGVQAQPTPDGMVIEGREHWTGGVIQSHGDHRIAMSFAMAALRAQQSITIFDCANVATSFPGFSTCAHQAGLRVSTAS